MYHFQTIDLDLDSTVVLSITNKASTQSDTCFGSPGFGIDDAGNLLVKDALYTYLNVNRYPYRFDDEQAVCDYEITATDVAAETEQFTTIDAKVCCIHV